MNLIKVKFSISKFMVSNLFPRIQIINSCKRFFRFPSQFHKKKPPTINFNCNPNITRIKGGESKRVIQTSSFVWHLNIIYYAFVVYNVRCSCAMSMEQQVFSKQNMNTEYLWKSRGKNHSRLHVFA